MPTSHSKRPMMKWRLMALAGLLLAAPALAVSHGQPATKRRGVPVKPVVHAPTAEELFVKVLRSDDLFSYKGRQITTYWHTGRTTAVEVYHRPTDDRRLYYLSPESQHGRLLVSDGRQQWQYDPRRKEIRHRRLSPGALEEDDLLSYTLLRANYLLSVEAQPRTYGDRKVFLVAVKRPGGRTLARKFWIDAGSGLILKREVYGDDGKLAVTVAFSDIAYHPRLSPQIFDLSSLAKTAGVRLIETVSPSEGLIPLNSLAAQLAGKAYAPPHLAGYRLVGASTTTVGGKPLLHLRYSDGLNLVSLFEQRRTQARRPTVVRGMQKTQIGSVPGHVSHRASLTTLNWDTSTLNVTLMGEMGAATLHSLALAAVQNK